MLRNGQVRFGGRVGETDRRQRRHRAPARPSETCSWVPRRLLSLQYTIVVLSGWLQPTLTSRRATASRTKRACDSLTQWITASSAKRSNWMVGKVRSIQASSA